MCTRLIDLPLKDLRRSLRAAERFVGPNSTSANVLRRTIAKKTAKGGSGIDRLAKRIATREVCGAH